MDINSDLPKPEGLFERIIQFSIQNAIWVLLFACTWIAVGVYSYQKLPIDAVPDITNTQVQINTQAKGFTALEVEQLRLPRRQEIVHVHQQHGGQHPGLTLRR